MFVLRSAVETAFTIPMHSEHNPKGQETRQVCATTSSGHDDNLKPACRRKQPQSEGHRRGDEIHFVIRRGRKQLPIRLFCFGRPGRSAGSYAKPGSSHRGRRAGVAGARQLTTKIAHIVRLLVVATLDWFFYYGRIDVEKRGR